MAQGLTVVTENVLYYDYRGPMAPIDDLRTADGESLAIADANGADVGNRDNDDLTVICLHTDWKAAGFTKRGAPRSGAMAEEEAVRVEFIKTLLKGQVRPEERPAVHLSFHGRPLQHRH